MRTESLQYQYTYIVIDIKATRDFIIVANVVNAFTYHKTCLQIYVLNLCYKFLHIKICKKNSTQIDVRNYTIRTI